MSWRAAKAGVLCRGLRFCPESKEIVAVLTIALLMSVSAEAKVVSRLSGQAVYDTEGDLTWLADASYALTSGFDADDLLALGEANSSAAGLPITAVDSWLLAYDSSAQL